MPHVLLYPPQNLPETSLSEQQFSEWKNELEIYLGNDDQMARFMTGGKYDVWRSEERDPHRLEALHENDPDRPAPDARNRQDLMDELLDKRRRQLKTFLGQIAKCSSKNLYTTIIRHATSLEWIYRKIREEFDIQQKGVHFLNIIELKYHPDTHTPSGFYNQYRSVLLNNVARRNDIIRWNDNHQMDGDEQIGPLFEDHILLTVLNLIDSRLPAHVKNYYQLKMEDKRLMDVKTDIFVNIKCS